MASLAPAPRGGVSPAAQRLLRLQVERERHQAWLRATPPRLRDPLTGQGLLPDTVAFLVTRDYDVSRPSPSRAAIPYTLHLREADNGGGGTHPARRNKYALGGMRYAPGFGGYIADAFTIEGTLTEQTENRTTCEQWHTIPYLAEIPDGKVCQRFGPELTRALLAHLRDGLSLHEVAEAYGHQARWLARMLDTVARYVKREYGLGGRVGPLDGGHPYRAECPCGSCAREHARDVARYGREGETYSGGGLYDNTSVA